jgi:ParB family chromosome partitioning protein
MAKKALGQGLSALFAGNELAAKESGLPARIAGNERTVYLIPIDSIAPNPLQPRRTFQDESLEELAASIREHGIVQPLLVSGDDGEYQLIVGERRLRAAKLAGLDSVPVMVKEIFGSAGLELALLENLQREDLNPLEEAHAFQCLIRDYGLTQDDLASRLGRSRPAVSNTLRLLNLPGEIQQDVIAGLLSAGHARALLSLENKALQTKAWLAVKSANMSVRQTEDLVLKLQAGTARKARHQRLSPEWMDVQEELQRLIGSAVKIRPRNKEKGKIELHYSSREELDRIVELLFSQAEYQTNARSIGASLL